MHNDYPLVPEKLAIPYDMLSDYSKKIADEYGIKVSGVKKLIENLSNKTNFVVHYRNLQMYFSLGMKLTKIHKVRKFKQSDRMKNYIDFNTKKEKQKKNVANSFEKNSSQFFMSMIKQWKIYKKQSDLKQWAMKKII